MKQIVRVFIACTSASFFGGGTGLAESQMLPAGVVEMAPDGAWTWFNDEQAIILQNTHLLVGYVKSDGTVAASNLDLETRKSAEVVLSQSKLSTQTDDHNNPSFVRLPDRRILATYSMHGTQSQYYLRYSKTENPVMPGDWGEEKIRSVPAKNTYSNTYLIQDDQGPDNIIHFHRCIGWNPCWSYAESLSSKFSEPVELIRSGSSSTRPYLRYNRNRADQVDFIYTDGHPRNEKNSLYHAYIKNRNVYKTDGTLLKPLAKTPLLHDQGERGSTIYAYNEAPWGPNDGPDDWMPSGRAWSSDLHADPNHQPVCVFSVRRANVTGSGWQHNRIYYYYARWTGTEWQKHFIAQAGRPLYDREGDYAGGICIDPDHPNTVYLSSNALQPFALENIDEVTLHTESRYEIYRGVTADEGRSFTWTAITQNSPEDNIRPVVPRGHGRSGLLIWLRGTYSSYTHFKTRVVALIGDKE